MGYFGLFALAPEADVQTIAVSPKAQGKGLGSLLLNELISQALDRGCDQLMLEVRSDNDSALALYARFGFEEVTVRRNYYAPSVDAIVMRQRPLRKMVKQ
jgi:ribosomal-protein-alanine N-acetyltransferase